ncbi:hypothetical protein BD413DRAFT_637622 [Trametes elegans]|nr:hypothetical protein BD413DRAFT_637622 [Trametes elegans]
MTGATALFLATRYLALFSIDFLGAATYSGMSNSVVLLNSSHPAFSSLRTLALSGMNWPLAVVTFCLGSVPFAINAWTMALGITGMNAPVLGCVGGDSLVSGVAAGRSCLIASDIMVLVVTLWSTVRNGRLRTNIGAKPSLANVLIFNGGTLVTLNIIHLTLTLISIVDSLDPISEVTILTDPITAILVCRFLLALQSADQEALDQGSSSTPSRADNEGETLRFASRVVGSIGGTLEFAHDANSESSIREELSSISVEDIETLEREQGGPVDDEPQCEKTSAEQISEIRR